VVTKYPVRSDHGFRLRAKNLAWNDREEQKMPNKTWLIGLSALALICIGGPRAADHIDSPQAAVDPAADITDVFAWMSNDGSRVNLVMGIGRDVALTFLFSDQVHYVFHTSSKVGFLSTAKTDVDVICQFDAAQTIQCWAGNEEYVTGDASGTAGLSSGSGRMRVFAGVRNDPFFFNLNGFKAAAVAVENAASGLTFDAAGCPALDQSTAGALGSLLTTGVDDFGGFNIGALVVSVDKSVLTRSGPILSVWGATHRR
jgi:hypothetical protein